MILRIDHIGVATEDLDGVGALLGALGMARDDAGLADAYGVACEFWQISPGPGQISVELVAPVRDDSAISTHLERHGAGPYHIAFEVDDIVAELARLRTRGFAAVDRVPCQGARTGMQVAFMYLPKPAGFLIELVKYDRVSTR